MKILKLLGVFVVSSMLFTTAAQAELFEYRDSSPVSVADFAHYDQLSIINPGTRLGDR